MGPTNAELLERAYRVLPGASLGSYYLPEAADFVVATSAGARVYDADGRAYLDYVLGSGPLILGHGHPEVVAAVQRQAEKGFTFYALNDATIELGERIVAAAPC